MQTFKFQADVEFSLIIPEQVLQDVRKAVNGELEDEEGKPIPPSKFLAEQVGKSDDELMLAVLGNAVRIVIRDSILSMAAMNGSGAKVAPVRLLRREPVQYATPPKIERVKVEVQP